MPVYEYRCSACEKEFEYQQRMSEPAKTTCEECGGGLERLISRTAFQFKGGGWYKDLYSSAKPAEAKGTEAKGEAKSDAKADAKSDAKPDAKPDAKKSGGDSGASGGSGGSGTSGGSGGSSGPSTSSSKPAAA